VLDQCSTDDANEKNWEPLIPVAAAAPAKR